MLTRIRIHNFKALKKVDLKLRERNVFIGPNKSGKSSILQVLNSLTQFVIAGDVGRVCYGQLGFQQLLWKGISDGSMKFEIWGDDRPVVPPTKQPSTFYYSIEIGLDALRNVAVLEENLHVEQSGTAVALIEAKLGRGTARRSDGEIVFADPESSIKPFLSYEIPGWEAEQLRRYVQGWQFFRFVPELSRVVAAQASARPFLDPAGEQLSAWLHTFNANYPEAFNRIVSVAKEAFPEIESLSTPVTQAGTTFLSMKEHGLRSPISVFHASDGEIKFLQLLSIIFSPFPVSLVAIEEPETHLHPRLLELLVETADRVRIENEGMGAQVFATTHSPYLIDKLSPEDVVVVEKVEGATRCTRAEDQADLKRLLEESELSFGRLWYSGALGGI